MKKRGLSLFLALALCLTLLPAAAFANGEPETPTPHTHYLCGNAEACSHVGGHNETDKTTFATAIRQAENGTVYVQTSQSRLRRDSSPFIRRAFGRPMVAPTSPILA